VRKKPSTKASSLSVGFRYPGVTPMPLTSTSPSSEMRMVVPGTGGPTVPERIRPGRFPVQGAVVSVRP